MKLIKRLMYQRHPQGWRKYVECCDGRLKTTATYPQFAVVMIVQCKASRVES